MERSLAESPLLGQKSLVISHQWINGAFGVRRRPIGNELRAAKLLKQLGEGIPSVLMPARLPAVSFQEIPDSMLIELLEANVPLVKPATPMGNESNLTRGR
jgi:hypothetical protein